MTISLKHNFQSIKGDGTDPTLIQPSNWNEEHKLIMAPNKVVGRLTAGTGPAEEITMTPFMAGLLASTDIAALVAALGNITASTGDLKLSIVNSIPGWVACNDMTIGDAASGATNRANADTAALYQAIWNNIPNAQCPVLGGRGTDALTDFNAHKQMTLPRTLGRLLGAAGSVAGAGLTARSVAAYVGTETNTILDNQLPPHTHSGNTGNPNQLHSHPITTVYAFNGVQGGGSFSALSNVAGSAILGNTGGEFQSHVHPFTTDVGPGTSQPINNMSPSAFFYLHIKL